MTSIFFAFMGSSFGGCYCFFDFACCLFFLLWHYRKTVDGEVCRGVHAPLFGVARLQAEKHLFHHSKRFKIDKHPLVHSHVEVRFVIGKENFHRAADFVVRRDAVGLQLQIVALPEFLAPCSAFSHGIVCVGGVGDKCR